MTCIFHYFTCPQCLEGRLSGGLGVLYFLLHIPSLVLMSSFYNVIALNKELKTKNNRLEKFPQCFTARVGAAQHEYALGKLSSYACCFHVFLIENKKRSERIILIRSFPGGVPGFAARVGAGVDLKSRVAVLELLG